MSKIVIQNPLIWADVPDVDVVRYKNAFYMISTSMHSMPGCPIMKSTDLVHWELIHYVFETFDDGPGHTLADGKGVYGKGSWAASLKEFGGVFYAVFNCNDTGCFYVYKCEDIGQGKWQQVAKMDAFFHDPALHFESDGTPYVIYGGGEIRIVELTRDLKSVKEGGVHKLLLDTPREGIMLRCEGGHAYKIGDYYYLIYIEWPSEGNKRRREICYRSTELLGPYERKIILDDDMEFANQGVAQGGLLDDGAGNWYAMLFQDHFAVGRIPYLMPVTWEDNWPMIGIKGRVPREFEIELPWESEDAMSGDSKGGGMRFSDEQKYALVISDDFYYEEDKLALQWQWNHNPDNALWSVTDRPGYLRLTTGRLVEKGVQQARNTLTQRTEGPGCKVQTRLDFSNLKVGDSAGIVAMQGQFGCIGVKRLADDKVCLQVTFNDGNYAEQAVWSKELPADMTQIDLQMEYDFSLGQDKVTFSYSVDGKEYVKTDAVLQMRYTLDHFMGYRSGLYCYATKEAGGYADFDYFKYSKDK